MACPQEGGEIVLGNREFLLSIRSPLNHILKSTVICYTRKGLRIPLTNLPLSAEHTPRLSIPEVKVEGRVCPQCSPLPPHRQKKTPTWVVEGFLFLIITSAHPQLNQL